MKLRANFGLICQQTFWKTDGKCPYDYDQIYVRNLLIIVYVWSNTNY